ncbi:hypothetical protein RvY_14248 [Ramazzottius varieornatus]|uniref:G-protein coupled receptors family 1 profile domain-containing protein n=1 Tax=Ramazzottius varieornatus TaxID=947166 RepID=A0A1D1VZ34_RAMVA|nr:hypothetical protein RvY_14248 [Ramazzottius varieornatus]
MDVRFSFRNATSRVLVRTPREFSNFNPTGLLDTSRIPQPAWSFSALVALFAIIAGGILNLTVLTVFISRRSLRNSFGVYLMNLLVVDSTLVLLHGPFNLIDKYYPSWTLGHRVCSFVNYMSYAYQNLIILGHFLIAFNRVWAVVFPFSYRTHHTTKVAVALCASAWIILNICNIPVAIITTVITPGAINGTLRCDIDPERLGVWDPISQILLFDIPILCVILAYPVVCYKSFFSNRQQKVAPLAGTHTMVRGRQGTHFPTDKTSAHHGEREGEDHREKDRRTRIVVCGRALNGSPTGFLTLTLTTCSFILCLMPKEAYYTWLMATDIDPPGVADIVDVLHRLTTVFDPLLVVLGNTELRMIIFDWLQIFRPK